MKDFKINNSDKTKLMGYYENTLAYATIGVKPLRRMLYINYFHNGEIKVEEYSIGSDISVMNIVGEIISMFLQWSMVVDGELFSIDGKEIEKVHMFSKRIMDDYFSQPVQVQEAQPVAQDIPKPKPGDIRKPSFSVATKTPVVVATTPKKVLENKLSEELPKLNKAVVSEIFRPQDTSRTTPKRPAATSGVLSEMNRKKPTPVNTKPVRKGYSGPSDKVAFYCKRYFGDDLDLMKEVIVEVQLDRLSKLQGSKLVGVSWKTFQLIVEAYVDAVKRGEYPPLLTDVPKPDYSVIVDRFGMIKEIKESNPEIAKPDTKSEDADAYVDTIEDTASEDLAKIAEAENEFDDIVEYNYTPYEEEKPKKKVATHVDNDTCTGNFITRFKRDKDLLLTNQFSPDGGKHRIYTKLPGYRESISDGIGEITLTKLMRETDLNLADIWSAWLDGSVTFAIDHNSINVSLTDIKKAYRKGCFNNGRKIDITKFDFMKNHI